MQNILEKAAQIRMVIFDVDGVLTDGSLFLGDDGLEYKAFNSKDGHGMKMLQHSGVEIAIITGRASVVVEKRMESLGIQHVYQGRLEKLLAYEELKQKVGLKDEEVAYAGDDVVDLPIMTKVGLAIAVQDAHKMVKQHAHWQTDVGGGRGAAREVCELIMEAKGTLDETLKGYL
ncbi:3-deoxy-D-manno-octulosonate 8-phosphate phosphatase [Solemya velesiana gill symbiont]|uniref:3-deoxy-D-manno-octulosonate 8-phosphate phosphatase KdsC n=1 Tax=Solemya velesiana gill symbiont TaxID=1918948 RepID=A0A1T2KVB5_9GAMM|nr:3-deoxy-manno-octulosonate-8-phosphatase KdsC [Solemya velesiana gill symbiont]OOZ36789.1 3-deoxy-D-manno-octulosonate 8-phosphate phosphatase [Solemya velesiana gill symbiont]